MIRVLFVVLAVVAIVLAIVLARPVLYLGAIVLLVAAAAMLAGGMRRRHAREIKVVRPPAEPRDELRDLGIVGIRPRGAGEGADEPDDALAEEEPTSEPDEVRESGRPAAAARGAGRATEAERRSGMKPMTIGGNGPLFGQPLTAAREERKPEHGTPHSEHGAAGHEAGAGSVRKKSRTARILVEGVSDAFDGEVMLSVLRGLRAAVDATTVCLLRQEEGALSYSVEAVVSRNAFARNGGRFAVTEALLAGHRPLEPVVLSCAAPGGFEPKRLGYYHETIAIRQVAFVPMSGADGRAAWLLVADSMGDSGLERTAATRALAEFGRLVHSFVSRGMTAPSRSTPAGVPLRPRREIIADEMDAARDGRAPLALALVYLNRAESIGESGEGTLRDVDEAFHERLKSSTSDGRVERFGELTYGVFRCVEVDDAARWASDLQARMAGEGGLLEGGVSVGVAMLGDRHDGPDQLRSDATAALRESYETGECVILE
jgi:hypothetical protein